MSYQLPDEYYWRQADGAKRSPKAAQTLIGEIVAQFNQNRLGRGPLLHDAYICFVAKALDEYLKTGNLDTAFKLRKVGRPAKPLTMEDIDLWLHYRRLITAGEKYEFAVSKLAEESGKSLQRVKRFVAKHEKILTRLNDPSEGKGAKSVMDEIKESFGYHPTK